MQRNKSAKNFLPKPIYRGGPKAMRMFIKDTLTYPPEAREQRIQGVVVLRITIDYQGNVIDSKIKAGLGFGCDEEAQRVVSLMKFEFNRKARKRRVLYHKTINITFRLPKSKPANQTSAQKTKLTYRIVKSSPEITQKTDPSPESYSYTITY
ncbi:MAG: energy transducer TonB [Bacteroidota bacterium]